MLTQLELRPFAPHDYEALARLGRAVYPDDVMTADEFRYQDKHQDPRSQWGRLVVAQADTLIGSARYWQPRDMLHPHHFRLNLHVHPDHRRQGFGGRLYTALMAELAPHNPLRLRFMTSETDRDAHGFLERRGFYEEEREWESRLDPQSFDPAPYEGLEGKLEEQGIVLKPLERLLHRPDIKDALYEADWEISQDDPHSEPLTQPERESWLTAHFEHPGFCPEAYLLALHGEDIVGLSALWRSKGGFNNGLTGVKRTYRRKGIALAMKVKNLVWLKAQGVTQLRTWNHSSNRAMLSINERLLFQKQPTWLGYRKDLKETL